MPAGTPTARKRITVVGAGVGGPTAAYLLQRPADVTLYEAEDRLGRHAHTHDVQSGVGRTLAVDTGFIVHNRRTYPTLLRLRGTWRRWPRCRCSIGGRGHSSRIRQTSIYLVTSCVPGAHFDGVGLADLPGPRARRPALEVREANH